MPLNPRRTLSSATTRVPDSFVTPYRLIGFGQHFSDNTPPAWPYSKAEPIWTRSCPRHCVSLCRAITAAQRFHQFRVDPSCKRRVSLSRIYTVADAVEGNGRPNLTVDSIESPPLSCVGFEHFSPHSETLEDPFGSDRFAVQEIEPRGLAGQLPGHPAADKAGSAQNQHSDCVIGIKLCS